MSPALDGVMSQALDSVMSQALDSVMSQALDSVMSQAMPVATMPAATMPETPRAMPEAAKPLVCTTPAVDGTRPTVAAVGATRYGTCHLLFEPSKAH